MASPGRFRGVSRIAAKRRSNAGTDSVVDGPTRSDRQPGVSPVQRVDRSRPGRFLVLLVFLAGAALFFRDQVLPAAQRFWETEVAPRLAGQLPDSARRVPSPVEVADPVRVPPQVHREELIEALQPVAPAMAEVPVRLASGFRPAGFRMAAMSHPLLLVSQPPQGLRLPATTGRAAFGALPLHGGREYALMLVSEGGGHRLYVDRNRNRDLTDDGPPLESEGAGGFGTSLRLPLPEVTGRPLEGSYDLWVNFDARRADRLQVYCRTQLSGEVVLGGRPYPALVADNLVLDGDYTNDGIAIDLDGDKRFKGPREIIAPGQTLELSGTAYRFDLAW